MLIQEDKPNTTYQIRSYTTGKIIINTESYTKSLIVSANQLITDWPPQNLNELDPMHWESIIALKPEVILLGTGEKFILPPHIKLAPLYAHQIGVECMDTGAACRTFTALSAENRRVVAALLIR